MATLKQNIQLGIREMLKKYTNCNPNNILAGYNNHVQLPADNDYIIFTILNPMRYGTPRVVTTLQGNTSYQNYRIPVQIDFYGDLSFDRANDIINISRTEFLCQFLEPYGIQPIACDEATMLSVRILAEVVNREQTRVRTTLAPHRSMGRVERLELFE